MVHVILCTPLSRIRDRFLCLAFGADKQDPAAFGDSLAHNLKRLLQHRERLCQIEDVDAIPVAVDELTHTGVPACLLVAKVNASFKKLPHGKFWKRHAIFLFRFARRAKDQSVARYSHACSTGGLSGEFAPSARLRLRSERRIWDVRG